MPFLPLALLKVPTDPTGVVRVLFLPRRTYWKTDPTRRVPAQAPTNIATHSHCPPQLTLSMPVAGLHLFLGVSVDHGTASADRGQGQREEGFG